MPVHSTSGIARPKRVDGAADPAAKVEYPPGESELASDLPVDVAVGEGLAGVIGGTVSPSNSFRSRPGSLTGGGADELFRVRSLVEFRASCR